jgi:phosphate transport system protein
MIEHTTRAFDVELQELGAKIGEMGRLDKRQITDAIGALIDRDIDLAERIISTDDEVDELQRQIEEKIIITIARRQPMAVDLRELVGTLRIAIDLERIGDLAENVAKRVALINEIYPINDVMLQLHRMVQLVIDQLTRVLESYQQRNAQEAMAVWQKDKEIDALNNSLLRELLTYMMENPRNISLCTHLLFCAKNIERMGDHITNIAESVYYIVQGHPLPKGRPKADAKNQRTLPLSA